MARLPEYVGPAAFGIKMGVIVPGMDLITDIVSRISQCVADELVDDYDVLCVTESIVARAQDNIVTLDEIVEEIVEKLKITSQSKLGVVFPILSRNRFALILKAIARAVPEGKVVVQLTWPNDEVGNQAISDEVIQELGKNYYDTITESQVAGKDLYHPVTGVDYIKLYRDVISNEGAEAEIFLANDPRVIIEHDCDGVIVADIHSRAKTQKILENKVSNLIGLVDICSNSKSRAWSEWGLLGSNMSAGDSLKLAPHSCDQFVVELKEEIMKATGKDLEVLVNGDGAYKDPSTGIYELADPIPVFGATSGLNGAMRKGIKYKYLADMGLKQGKSVAEIESDLERLRKQDYEQSASVTEGTTPRLLGDVVASLADLVSGSSDAGTPLVIVKGLFSPE